MRFPLAALLVLAGCAGPAPAALPGPPTPPRDALGALEQRLLAARTFRVRARLQTGGRIVERFEGTLTAGPGQRLRFAFEGSAGNREASARLVSDATRMRGGSREASFDFDAPAALREGVVVAFVRLGLAHHVRALSHGNPPDFLDGKARQHVEAMGATSEPGELVHGAPTERWSWMTFVDHERAAEVQLWLDARTGLPARRRVTMHFPEGDVDVAEDYDEVLVDEPEDDASFTIPGPARAP